MGYFGFPLGRLFRRLTAPGRRCQPAGVNTTIDFAAVDREIEGGLDASLAELCRLVAQPSVAAQDLGMRDCAELVAGMLRARGFTAEIAPTGGHPVVVAERAGRSERTLLI